MIPFAHFLEFPDEQMVPKLKVLHRQLRIARSPLRHVTERLLSQLYNTDRMIDELARYFKYTPEWQRLCVDHEKYGISKAVYHQLREAVRFPYSSARWSTVAAAIRSESNRSVQMKIMNAALEFMNEMHMTPTDLLPEEAIPKDALICRDFREFHEYEIRHKSIIERLNHAVRGLTDEDAIKEATLFIFNSTQNHEAQTLILYTGARHLCSTRKPDFSMEPPRWMRRMDEDPNPFAFLDDNDTDDDDSDEASDGDDDVKALEERLEPHQSSFSPDAFNDTVDKVIEGLENDEAQVVILHIGTKRVPEAAELIANYLHLDKTEVTQKLCNAPAFFKCDSTDSADQLKALLDKICLCA